MCKGRLSVDLKHRVIAGSAFSQPLPHGFEKSNDFSLNLGYPVAINSKLNSEFLNGRLAKSSIPRGNKKIRTIQQSEIALAISNPCGFFKNTF